MKRLAIPLALTLMATPAWASETATVLSAPILPEVLTLYTAEGDQFPATLAEAEALVDAAALAFDDLSQSCGALEDLYDLIAEPTTAEEMAHNYGEIARCAYEQYTSKPYWVPALVDQVDVCARTLGEAWSLLSEEDVASFSEEDLVFIRDTLASVGSTSSYGDFYFALRVWVRAADGQLAQADLTPGLVGPRVTPLPVGPADDGWKRHLESGLSLRCVSTLAE